MTFSQPIRHSQLVSQLQLISQLALQAFLALLLVAFAGTVYAENSAIESAPPAEPVA